MSEYISYDEYKSYGGELSDKSAFSLLERKARGLLDYWTQERINAKPSLVDDDVKMLMKEMIDRMLQWDDGERLSSFSNGKVSMQFDISKTEEQELFNLLPMYLSPALYCRGVDRCT